MGGISVITQNGETNVYINNKKVDFDKAKIIEQSDAYTVYQPTEDKDLVIVVGKDGGIMIQNHGSVQISTHGSSMTPEQRAEFEKKMKDLEIRLENQGQELAERLNNLGQEINDRVQQSLTRVFGGNLFGNY